MNDSRTNGSFCAEAVPDIRTLENLGSFMHGYVIKSGGEGNEPRRFRAANIEGLIKTLQETRSHDHAQAIFGQMRRQATELAALDPSLSWLPEWKPRVVVKGGAA